MTGFIVMSRDAIDHPLLRDGERFRAWFWMVAKACWKPTKFDVHGKVVQLERGQFCCSVREMAEAWGWSKSAVDRFIQRLVDEDMVISTRAKTGTGGGTASGTSRSIITICNYAKYQDVSHDGGTVAEPQSGTAAGQQRDIKEQGNHSDVLEPSGSNTSRRAPKPKLVKFAMPPDWQPAPFPADIAELVAQWPPGRIEREIADVRAYWIEDGTKRPGWDRTLHSRIRNIHDRVLREARDDRPIRHQRNGNSSVRELGLQLAERRRAAGNGVVDLLPRLGSSGGHG